MRGATTRALKPGDETTGFVMLDHDTVAVRIGTKKGGRHLDGREWMQVPASPAGQGTLL
jgi:hypothetical protein